MVQLKSAEELELMKESAQILGRAHAEVAKAIAPGVKTIQLDKLAEEYIRDHGAKGSFKGFNGFPFTLCLSPNEVVVHGFAGDYELKETDVISIDCGVYYKGFHSDSAYTYRVSDAVPAEVQQLLRETEASLHKGIAQATHGNRMGDIGYAIQSHVEQFGYGVVRELVGHGVGADLHEAPEVPNYGKRGRGPKLQAGMVLAIEPMVTLGKRHVVQEADGWTIRTRDRQAAAHFEHTVAITEEGPEVITTWEYIEEVLNEK